jgi:CzcA family heavy metal efflux pump
MFDRLVRWSLENRLLAVVAAGLVLIAGSFVAATAPVDVFPDLTAPTVTILTDAHGMAPEEVEAVVTFPIETAVNGATGVRRVRSSSAQGISIVWVDFDWGTNIFRARQVVTEKLQLAASQLPEDVDAPVLAPITSIMGEIMLVGLSAPVALEMEARTHADWTIRRRLLALPGVAQVVPIGGWVKQYQVTVNPDRLRAYEISLHEVLRAASEANRNAAGGVYRTDGREVLIRGLGRARSIDDIEATVVATRGATPILLRDVAEVEIGPKVRFGTAAVNAEPAVIISIQKQPLANTLELTRRIDEELDAIESELPSGIRVEREIFRQADFIELAVDNVVAALRDGAILVIVVLFLFLWSFRTTAISVLAIPLSLAIAVLALRAIGGTINTMTLGGMAIAIGALVDDAIIFVENVFRRLRENRLRPEAVRKPALDVIYAGAREIRAPILNATLIITIVFVPLFFLSGVEGRMLRPLGLAYIVSILSSLLVAVTVTPALCAYLLPRARFLARERESWLVERLKGAYERTLRVTLAVPRLVLAAAALLVAGTLAIVPSLGSGFLPEFQEGTLTVSTVTMPGTALDEADRIGATIERRLLGHPAVTSTARRTGRAELDEHAQAVNASEIDVRLDLTELRLSRVMEDVRDRLAGLPATAVTVGQPIGHRIDHMLSGTRAAIAIKLFGPDLRELRDLGRAVRDIAETVDGVVDLSVEQQADVPQIQVRARRDAMAKYGVTSAALAEVVDVGFSGEIVSQIREAERVFDLVVRFDEQVRGSVARMAEALVDTPLGPKVPLGELAVVEPGRGPNTINRENVQRKLVVSANVAGRDVGGVVGELRDRIAAEVALPLGYRVEFGGQFESGRAATRAITILSIFSLAAIFLILFQEFGNLRTAMLLLVNLPLALTGGVFAVLLSGGIINVATLVGFITLFGIAVRNGILLVSRYVDLARAGSSPHEAITRGSLERLSPILMTALTAALALVPLAIGLGEPGKEIQAPLAIVVLGGLFTSTALNMVVVPALFLRYGGLEGSRPRNRTNPEIGRSS